MRVVVLAVSEDRLMARGKSFRKIVIPPILGMTLATEIGCGGGTVSPQLAPDAGVKQQEARYRAYGKAGVPGSNIVKLKNAPGSPKP